MVRPGSGRFGVGFWVGFWVGLRARDFPTERVLSRTPLIIRTVDHKLLKSSLHFSYNFNRILQKYKKVKNLLSFFLANLHF